MKKLSKSKKYGSYIKKVQKKLKKKAKATLRSARKRLGTGSGGPRK